MDKRPKNPNALSTAAKTGLYSAMSLLTLAPANLLLPTVATATEEGTTTQAQQMDFLYQIAPVASDVAAANDLYASVMIAQALLESSYGQSQLAQAPYYNLFGVKGTSPETSVVLPTAEYLDETWIEAHEPFRVYGSYYESFQGNATLLANYYIGVSKSETTHYSEATAALTGTYATDPQYNEKLNTLIQTLGLTAYDTPAAGTETTATTMAHQAITQTYKVASGDTLWEIAVQADLTVEQLMALNGLTAETIVIGQVLHLG